MLIEHYARNFGGGDVVSVVCMCIYIYICLYTHVVSVVRPLQCCVDFRLFFPGSEKRFFPLWSLEMRPFQV